MWEPSTAALERSRAFALRSLARRTSCSRGHNPASIHSARRRPGHARTESEFLWQVFPGDPGVQDEQDALEHQPVRMPLASRMPGPTLNAGKQRLDHRPQLVIHFPRLRPRHPAPPDHRSWSDPTISKIISLGVKACCTRRTAKRLRRAHRVRCGARVERGGGPGDASVHAVRVRPGAHASSARLRPHHRLRHRRLLSQRPARHTSSSAEAEGGQGGVPIGDDGFLRGGEGRRPTPETATSGPRVGRAPSGRLGPYGPHVRRGAWPRPLPQARHGRSHRHGALRPGAGARPRVVRLLLVVDRSA